MTTTTTTTDLAVEVVGEGLVEVPCGGQELVLGALDLGAEGLHVAQCLRGGQPLHRHLALGGTQEESGGGCCGCQVHHLEVASQVRHINE